jgi:hypothetical protein
MNEEMRMPRLPKIEDFISGKIFSIDSDYSRWWEPMGKRGL